MIMGQEKGLDQWKFHCILHDHSDFAVV